MNGKLIPVFVLTALMSCSQPPVKEQGPRPVKLENHLAVLYRLINLVTWLLRCPVR